MKVKQFRDVLEEVCRQRRAAGEDELATALKRFAACAKPHDGKTVLSLAKLIRSNLI